MQHKTQAVSFVVAFYRPESYVSDIAECKTLILKSNKMIGTIRSGHFVMYLDHVPTPASKVEYVGMLTRGRLFAS